MRRVVVFVAAAAVLGLGFGPATASVTDQAATSVTSVTSHGERCGALDKPETGLQGDVPRLDQLTGRATQGYNCGVDLVGHTDLGARGGNANMAWSGHCAYVAGAGNGIAVVDVSDPAHPIRTTTLHGPGSDFTLETLNAFTGPGHAVLAAGRYGPAPIGISAPVDLYDVSTCAHPRLVSTFTFPTNVHNLTFSPDGRRLYATLPLQVLDVTDIAHPRFLGKIEDQIPQTAKLPVGKYLAHEVWTSPDGNILYLGGQTPMFDTFTIVDVTGWPGRPPKVLSQVEGRGHSIRTATIGGRVYALHSEESVVDPTAKGCLPETLNPFAGVSEPWLTDVTDPAHPIMRISQFHLAINDPTNCVTQIADGVNASVHYHDVDDPSRTTFAMLSMWNAGLRIVDIRDPRHPREVGYFNPGAFRTITGIALDQAWGHIRYVASTGQLWFATATGGFWVVELEPQVRAELGLPARAASHPHGSGARTVASAASVVATRPDTYRYYCTLGVVRAAVLSR